MDQEKIGRLIAERRKAVGLTQVQLAERLNVTDRAVSKWERGRAMPDSSLMLALCAELKITVNDLLNGEVVTMDHYKEKADRLLLEMTKQKEESDRQLLILEVLIGFFSVIILLGFVLIACFLSMASWLRVCLLLFGLISFLVGVMFALKIEQTAGYYKCEACGHKYVPTFRAVLFAPHVNRTRYLKCPKCKEKSWNRKVLRKD